MKKIPYLCKCTNACRHQLHNCKDGMQCGHFVPTGCIYSELIIDPPIKKEIPFAVIIAFLIGAVFGIIVTACMLQIEIVKARHEGIEIGRDYERSIWDRFPTGG